MSSGSSSGLIAIVLAIKSSRGHQIVFHYPPEPLQDSDNGVSADSRSMSADSYLPTISERDTHEESATQRKKPWDTILSHPSSLLADIFTPHKSDNKFELWMDDLVFLGSPAHIRPDGSWIKRKQMAEKPDTRGEDVSSPVSVTGSSANLLSPHPTTSSTTSPSTSPSPMTVFHLVFALETPKTDAYHKQVKQMYESIVTQLTFALTYEQARSEYVWKQCELILDIKEKSIANGTPLSLLWDHIKQASDLARVMARTFDAISRNQIAHLLINKHIHLSLGLPSELSTAILPSDTDPMQSFLSSALSFGSSLHDASADPLVLPHWALLLLDEPDAILAAAPPGASPLLVRFLKAIKPTLSFSQLAEVTKIPLHDVSTLARHLVHWRCALPIAPLHPRRVYAVSPISPIHDLSKQSAQFSQRFPTVPPLPKVLSLLSRKAVPWGALIPSKNHRSLYLDVLTWMMRERWLMEVRTFVWVRVRKEIKQQVAADAEAEQAVVSDAPAKDWEVSIITDPYSASSEERLWLQKMASTKPAQEAKLFERVVKYFNGKHAMEKVLVREGLHKKTLRRCLEAFKDDLVQSQTW
ncbi:nitrogen permease regulator of amino acid transport activity 3-domain-containing protein [Protomyces lactucae-debilis]|uniref:Nitrogen permease regulator 3 n=1 Tax=Protomyces lactucae-debilis TaxID=2754530 RepID=A0A1Y2F2M7_PROLT|nr:nitrogen permease regulator of amino acid transport activity 3-domain-containing protein [Protomyces lactucae-debilis]ORY78140.1 nitrogen permease regulator of amino acid transport activity 3-domain-containing protein [Protomyces lactucae-debilis]